MTTLMLVTLLVTVFFIPTQSFSPFGPLRSRRPPPPPLFDDRKQVRSMGHGAPYCSFGNSTFEVEEKWKPDLGPPFGVLFCVRCECISRKNKQETRVRCKNIKGDCPKPLCDNPVLLPGRCCKTCPDDIEPNFEDDLNGKKITRKEDEGKKIYSLVKPKSPVKPTVPTVASPLHSMDGFEVSPTHGHHSHHGHHRHSSNNHVMEDQEKDVDTGSSHKCYYEGEIFEDGSQWKAQHKDCQMCSCQRGRIKCHDILCPEVSCSHPETLTGECCPSCPGDTMMMKNVSTPSSASSSSHTSYPASSKNECYFEGDKKHHLAGTKWHPYVPPFGFDRCSVCTCLPDSLLIECKRSVTCPPLTCPDHEAFRENPMDCCKRCPLIPVKSLTSSDQLGDQRSSSPAIKSPNELLASGGCKFKGRVFPNGDEWHPTVQPFGEVKCVNCHCKDSRVKCKRLKCPKLTCSNKIIRKDECCPRCPDQTHPSNDPGYQ